MTIPLKSSGAKISIIGCGWVGTNLGKGLITLGHDVVFYDIVNKDLPNSTRDLNHAIENSDVSFVCVPTLTTKAGIDLKPLKKTAEGIGRAIASKKTHHIVVIKSTVIPTTTEKIITPILARTSKKKLGQFGVCVNPEFITESSNTWNESESMKVDFFTDARIVIGDNDKKSGDVLEEIYKPLNKPVFRTDLKTAEMTKYAANCMLTAKISYWNEIFLICNELNIDSQSIAETVALDPRIGRYGIVHGKAFGGKCLPKDLKAFIIFAMKYRHPSLLKAVDEINEEMRQKYGVRE